jgi:hypothetical protein
MYFYFIKIVNQPKTYIKLLVSIKLGVMDRKIFHLLSLIFIKKYFTKISIAMHLKHSYFVFMHDKSLIEKWNLKTYFQFGTVLLHKVFLNIKFQIEGKKQSKCVYRNDLPIQSIDLLLI